MFDHVTLRVGDLEASERFYSTVLQALGVVTTYHSRDLVEWHDFSIAPAGDGHPPTRGLHVGVFAPAREEVDAFWQAGVDAGYHDAGAPGERPQYSPDYYGAFLLDPDGNSAEAVHHGGTRERGRIDHLSIRVADLPAARRFYELVGPIAGFAVDDEDEGRVHFAGASGAFSLLTDDRPRTEHVHMAFPAHEHGTVEAFHRAATAAGYADNGPPGERFRYHPGYYAAYVLDPDGHNIEVVDHGRG